VSFGGTRYYREREIDAIKDHFTKKLLTLFKRSSNVSRPINLSSGGGLLYDRSGIIREPRRSWV